MELYTQNGCSHLSVYIELMDLFYASKFGPFPTFFLSYMLLRVVVHCEKENHDGEDGGVGREKA